MVVPRSETTSLRGISCCGTAEALGFGEEASVVDGEEAAAVFCDLDPEEQADKTRTSERPPIAVFMQWT
jgi:hypothetical protein